MSPFLKRSIRVFEYLCEFYVVILILDVRADSVV